MKNISGIITATLFICLGLGLGFILFGDKISEFREPTALKTIETTELETIKPTELETIETTELETIETTELNSPNALLVEAESGRILMSKNSQQKAYPASLTKVMTLLVAVETIADFNSMIQVPSELFANLQQENAAMAGFSPDEWVSVIDLLYGMMLPSGAESTLTIARHVAGSEDNFVELMNQKAKEIGLKNTNFVNPIGLHNPNHYTTAEDMITLLQYALNNDLFRAIFTTATYTTASGLTLESTLFSRLPSTSAVNNGEFIGGRTGYTIEGGRCLISLANINMQEYILVTMGAENSDENTIQHILDAIYIYNQL